MPYPLVDCGSNKPILDLGANVGYASRYFANHFGDRKILALEPDQDNFELLCQNVQCSKNIIPLQLAVGRFDGTSELSNPNSEGWARRYQMAEIGIEIVTVNTLMTKFNIDAWSIVKIDVEGAEKDIFDGDPSWSSSVDVLIIEIHHSCWKTVFRAL